MAIRFAVGYGASCDASCAAGFAATCAASCAVGGEAAPRNLDARRDIAIEQRVVISLAEPSKSGVRLVLQPAVEADVRHLLSG